jgi:holo-[acyl-carrier protein] synthase
MSDHESPVTLRTGIDLVEVDRLVELKEGIRQRFFQRVFTERELLEAGASEQYLAGRFAAKEAVSKALGSGIGAVGWREIEVLRGSNGEPSLVLGPRAQALSDEAGIISWSISISHTSQYAFALAVAVVQEPAASEVGTVPSEDSRDEDTGSK